MSHNTSPWVAYRQAAAEINKACQETIKAARAARQEALKFALHVRQEACSERRGYIKKGPPPSPTTEAYLAICETDTQAAIARKLGVSRQRVHQLERKFGLCQITPRRGKNKRVCPKCGGVKSYHGQICRACSKSPLVERICPICGKAFQKQASKMNGQKYCSYACWGKIVGKLYGFGRRVQN